MLTAKSIAKEIGILTNSGTAIEGPDFRRMTPDEQKDALRTMQVWRASPPPAAEDRDLGPRVKRKKGEMQGRGSAAEQLGWVDEGGGGWGGRGQGADPLTGGCR